MNLLHPTCCALMCIDLVSSQLHSFALLTPVRRHLKGTWPLEESGGGHRRDTRTFSHIFGKRIRLLKAELLAVSQDLSFRLHDRFGDNSRSNTCLKLHAHPAFLALSCIAFSGSTISSTGGSRLSSKGKKYLTLGKQEVDREIYKYETNLWLSDFYAQRALQTAESIILLLFIYTYCIYKTWPFLKFVLEMLAHCRL